LTSVRQDNDDEAMNETIRGFFRGCLIFCAASALSGCFLLEKVTSAINTQGPFEGTLHMAMVVDGHRLTSAIDIKGQSLRIGVGDEQRSSVLMRLDTNVFTAIDDDSKRAIELDVDDVEAFAEKCGLLGLSTFTTTSSSSRIPAPKLEKTGQGTAAGVDCERYLVHLNDGHVASICLAPLGKMPWTAAVQDSHLSAVLFDDQFPMRMTINDASGKEVSRFEVTQIERSSVADDRFVVPAGYQVLSVGDVLHELSTAFNNILNNATRVSDGKVAEPATTKTLAPSPPPAVAPVPAEQSALDQVKGAVLKLQETWSDLAASLGL
jgi:Domain of unknown function (DUF4412)